MIELLEHNVETYQKLCEEMEKHNKVALIQATGTGKSYIIGKYIEEHCKNALILVPTNAIGEQWEKLLPDTKIATYQAMAKGINGDYDIIVADEMHHLGSDVWGKKFIEYFMQNPEQKVIGATATEIRYLDNSRDMVDEIFDGVAVRGVDLATAIDKGVLPTFKYVVSQYGSEKDFNEYREKIKGIKDTEEQKNLSRRLEMCIQNQISIKEAMYENLSMANHKIIVFLNGLCEIGYAIEMFAEIFPNCDCNDVSHNKSNNDNSESIAKFQNSDRQISILLAIDMLNEGVHIDGVDSVVMFRNTESPQIYLQQLGRGISAGIEKSPIIFDFSCNYMQVKSVVNSTNENINIIKEINHSIQNRQKKIIVKSYSKDLNELFEQINFLSRGMFSEHEINLMKRGEMPFSDIAKKIGRNPSSVYTFMKRNGFPIKIKQKKFSTDEVDFIRNHTNLTADEIAIELGRSSSGVKLQCKKYGIDIKKNCIKLTDEQKKFILENYPQKGVYEIANELEKHSSVVGQFLKRNGISGKRIGINRNCRSVIQFEHTGEKEIVRFDSIKDAAYSVGGAASYISSAIKKRTTAYGYKWQYVDE